MKPYEILIVGAGLAGLSAAIALAQRGARVTVATLEDKAGGSSITITNRAVDAIEALGVLDACMAEGLAPSGNASIFASAMDGAGNPLPVPPPPPRPDDRLPAYIAIFRPDLSRIMIDAAQALGVTMLPGVTFIALDDRGDYVEATLSDGTRRRFDLVVGADGTHSAVRAITYPDVVPVYTGRMSLRIVLDHAPDGTAGFYSLTTNKMLATLRLPGNRLYLAAGKVMENRRVGQEEALGLLDQVLAHYPAPLIRAIRARLADKPYVIARPFERLLVPQPWRRGRILVIGDAAHATTPNLASGGSIAIEDGVVLGEELEKTADLEAALEAFSARRHARAALVVEAGHAMMRLADANADPRESVAYRSAAIAELLKPY